MEEVLQRYKPRAVMHFAAKCYVGESVRDPRGYYETNLILSLIHISEPTRPY